MIKEEFKPVPDYPMYEVSNLGQVRSAAETWETSKTWKPMHPRLSDHIYPHIHMRNPVTGKRKTLKVANLVLTIFGVRRPKGKVCCHKNGNGLDCNITNLTWGTWKESKAIREKLGHTAKGIKNGRAKLSESDVLEIRAYYDHPRNWENGRLLGSVAIAIKYGVDAKVIRDVGKRRIWRHVR